MYFTYSRNDVFAYFVQLLYSVYWCIGVFMYHSSTVLVYLCVDVLICRRICVIVCCCINVLMYLRIQCIFAFLEYLVCWWIALLIY